LHKSQDMKPQVMTSFLSISILGLGMQIWVAIRKF
jgi:hypothetical protein